MNLHTIAPIEPNTNPDAERWFVFPNTPCGPRCSGPRCILPKLTTNHHDCFRRRFDGIGYDVFYCECRECTQRFGGGDPMHYFNSSTAVDHTRLICNPCSRGEHVAV